MHVYMSMTYVYKICIKVYIEKEKMRGGDVRRVTKQRPLVANLVARRPKSWQMTPGIPLSFSLCLFSSRTLSWYATRNT